MPVLYILRIAVISIDIQVGESPSLICDYDISADQLYSVKWYKDNMEFYR